MAASAHYTATSCWSPIPAAETPPVLHGPSTPAPLAVPVSAAPAATFAAAAEAGQKVQETPRPHLRVLRAAAATVTLVSLRVRVLVLIRAGSSSCFGAVAGAGAGAGCGTHAWQLLLRGAAPTAEPWRLGPGRCHVPALSWPLHTPCCSCTPASCARPDQTKHHLAQQVRMPRRPPRLGQCGGMVGSASRCWWLLLLQLHLRTARHGGDTAQTLCWAVQLPRPAGVHGHLHQQQQQSQPAASGQAAGRLLRMPSC